MPHRPVRSAGLSALVLLLALAGGCKDATFGPDLFGSIEGLVMDFETGAALAGTSVTTSPPSGALVTDAAGRFHLADVPAGNYTITARRPGYETATTTIAVQGLRATEAAIFLRPEIEDTTGTADDPQISVEVTNFFNRVITTQQGDSVRVVVEYRVRNTGTVVVPGYEAYFRIVTPSGDFLQEVAGESIGVGQVDLGRFEKETGGARATEVLVDGYFIEPATAP